MAIAHYKWDGTNWTELEALPYDFYTGAAIVLNNEIHILGSSNMTYTKYHYELLPEPLKLYTIKETA